MVLARPLNGAHVRTGATAGERRRQKPRFNRPASLDVIEVLFEFCSSRPLTEWDVCFGSGSASPAP